jgi:putative Ca2+/H+ antiporter (TMEM165/GDT1 family)
MPDAVGLAVCIGFGSAVISLLAVVLLSFLSRRLRGRGLQRAQAPLWAVLAVVISGSFALYLRMHDSTPKNPSARAWSERGRP